MAENLSFKQKMLKGLYGMGMKNFGPTLLAEFRKGGPEWMNFVGLLIEGEDWTARKMALAQLANKSFLEKSREKDRAIGMILRFLDKGLSDEKKVALKFIEQNLALFPTGDDAFRAKILSLQRDKDTQLSSAATALLPKIGVNLDDRELYRRS